MSALSRQSQFIDRRHTISAMSTLLVCHSHCCGPEGATVDRLKSVARTALENILALISHGCISIYGTIQVMHYKVAPLVRLARHFTTKCGIMQQGISAMPHKRGISAMPCTNGKYPKPCLVLTFITSIFTTK